MIHVRTGQFEIKVDGHAYMFNPSFAAMARIGDDSELVRYFAIVHGGRYPKIFPTDPELRKRVLARCYGELVQTAIHILKSCAESEIGPLVGECRFTPAGKLRLRPGLLPTRDVITLAQHCMYHGLIGDIPGNKQQTDKQEGEYKSTFDVLDYVYSAVAHLGLSESEAWAMTMTGYRAAVRAKTPPEAKNEKRRPDAAIDKKAYDDGMQAARKALERMKKLKQKKARN